MTPLEAIMNAYTFWKELDSLSETLLNPTAQAIERCCAETSVPKHSDAVVGFQEHHLPGVVAHRAAPGRQAPVRE